MQGLSFAVRKLPDVGSGVFYVPLFTVWEIMLRLGLKFEQPCNFVIIIKIRYGHTVKAVKISVIHALK